MTPMGSSIPEVKAAANAAVEPPAIITSHAIFNWVEIGVEVF